MEEIIGECCECKAPCTDRDLVGNQIDLGFPVLWCDTCINRHLDEDENKRKAEGKSEQLSV